MTTSYREWSSAVDDEFLAHSIDVGADLTQFDVGQMFPEHGWNLGRGPTASPVTSDDDGTDDGLDAGCNQNDCMYCEQLADEHECSSALHRRCQHNLISSTNILSCGDDSMMSSAVITEQADLEFTDQMRVLETIVEETAEDMLSDSSSTGMSDHVPSSWFGSLTSVCDDLCCQQQMAAGHTSDGAICSQVSLDSSSADVTFSIIDGECSAASSGLPSLDATFNTSATMFPFGVISADQHIDVAISEDRTVPTRLTEVTPPNVQVASPVTIWSADDSASNGHLNEWQTFSSDDEVVPSDFLSETTASLNTVPFDGAPTEVRYTDDAPVENNVELVVASDDDFDSLDRRIETLTFDFEEEERRTIEHSTSGLGGRCGSVDSSEGMKRYRSFCDLSMIDEPGTLESEARKDSGGRVSPTLSKSSENSCDETKTRRMSVRCHAKLSSENLSEDSGYSDHGPQTHQSDDDVSPEYVRLSNGEVVHTPRIISGFMDIILRSIRLGVKSGVGSSDNASRVVNRTANLDSEPHVNRVLSISTPNLSPTAYQHRRRRRLIELIWRDALRRHQSCMGQTSASVRTLEAQSASQTLPTAMQNHSLPHAKCDNEIAGKHNFIVGHDTLPDINVCLANILRSADAVIPKYDLFKYPLFSRHRVNKSCFVNDIPSEYSSIYSSLEYRDRNPWASWVQCRMAGCEVSDLPFSKRNQLVRSSPNVHFSGRQTEAESRFSLSSAICSFAAPKETEENRHAHFKCASDDGREQPRVVSAAEECRLLTMHRSQTGRPKPLDLQLAEEFILLENNNDCSECAAHYTPMCDSRDACFGHGESAASIVAHESFSPNGTVVGSAAAAATASACPSYDTAASVFASGEEDGQLCSVNAVHSRCAELCAESCVCVPTIATRCQLAGVGMCERRSQVLFDETPTTAGNDTPAVNVTGDDERHCDRDGGSGNLTTNRIVLDAANLTDVTTSQACNPGELLSPYGHASRHMNVLSSFRPASNESVRSDPTLTICRTDCNSSFGSAAPLFHAQCGDGAPQCDTVRSAGELDRDNRFAHPAVYVCSVSAMRRPPLLPRKIIATKNVTDNQAEKRRIGESVCISSASDVCGFADTPPNTVAVEHLPARVSSPNLKSMEANRCVTPVITSDRTMPASLSSSTSVQRDGSGSLQLISRPFEDSAKRVVNERTKSYKPSLATKPASLKLIKRRAFLRNVPPPTIKPLEKCISSDKVTQASSDLPRHLSQNVKVYCNDVHVEERANNREFAGGVLPSAKCVNDSSDSAPINEFSSYTNGVNAVLRDHDCPSSHNTTNNLVVNRSTNCARDDSSGDVTVLKSVDRRLKADSQLLAALARVPRLSRSSHNLTQLVAPLTVSDTRGHFCDGLMSLPPPPQIPDPPMPTSMTCTRHVSAADRVEQSLRRFTDDTRRQRQELARSAPDLSRLIERSAQTLVSGREAALGDAVGHTAAPTPPRSRCHSPTTTRSHTPSAESNTFTTSRPPSIDRRDVTDSADCDDAGGDSRGGGRGVHRSCCCFSSVPLGYVPAGSCVYRNDVCGRSDCADGYCKRAECEDNGEVAGADDAASVETALRVSSSVLPSDSVSSSCAVVSSSGSKQRYARLRAEALARARCREQQQQQLPYRETDLDAVFEERLQLRHPPSHPSTQLAQPSLSSFHGAGSGRARAKSLADLPQVLDHNSDVSDSTTELAVTQRYDTMSTSFSSTSAAAVATSGSRAKSVEYLLNAVDKVATQPPENVLQQQRRGGGGGGATDGSGGGGDHCTSEHELRFQRSLRNLHVPDWYKRSVAAASPAGCAAGLRRDFGSGSLTGGWSGFNSKSNSKESLQSSQCTTPSSSTAAAAISQHPLPSTSSAAGIGSHAFFRNSASTSHLPGRCYSSTASPAVRAGGAGSRFFDWRSSAADGASSGVVAGPQQQHVYLGWRSQERLQAAAAGGGGAASSGGGGGKTGSATSSGYQTPAERLACSSIARMRSDSRLDSMGGGGWRRRHWRQPPSVDVHSSIRAVTSAIVDYFDSPDSTVAAGSSTSVSDLACRRGSRRSGTASPATCPMAAGTGSPWVETAFVGVKPTDQPSTPEATPDAAQCVIAASSHALQIAKQPSNSSFPVPTSNMGLVSVQTPRTLANGASPVLASSSNGELLLSVQ